MGTRFKRQRLVIWSYVAEPEQHERNRGWCGIRWRTSVRSTGGGRLPASEVGPRPAAVDARAWPRIPYRKHLYAAGHIDYREQIGRASCRERVAIGVVVVSMDKSTALQYDRYARSTR